MIIDWIAAKVRHFLPVQNTGLDELGVSFDFALSPEIMDLLYAQNDDMGRYFAPCKICIPHIPVGYAGGTTPRMREVESRLEQRSRATRGAVAEAGQQDQTNTIAKTQFALDEHELALA